MSPWAQALAAAGLALGVSLSAGCPGQRRPPPGQSAPSSASPRAAVSPRASAEPTPQSLSEGLASWTEAVDALLTRSEPLTPKDLPGIQALNERGGLLNEALLSASPSERSEEQLEQLENRLLELSVIRAQLVDASAEKGH